LELVRVLVVEAQCTAVVWVMSVGVAAGIVIEIGLEQRVSLRMLMIHLRSLADFAPLDPALTAPERAEVHHPRLLDACGPSHQLLYVQS